jgi:hypothetical protein
MKRIRGEDVVMIVARYLAHTGEWKIADNGYAGQAYHRR